MLDKRRGQNGAYIGCMKSGDVIVELYVVDASYILVQLLFVLVDGLYAR